MGTGKPPERLVGGLTGPTAQGPEGRLPQVPLLWLQQDTATWTAMDTWPRRARPEHPSLRSGPLGGSWAVCLILSTHSPPGWDPQLKLRCPQRGPCERHHLRIIWGYSPSLLGLGAHEPAGEGGDLSLWLSGTPAPAVCRAPLPSPHPTLTWLPGDSTGTVGSGCPGENRSWMYRDPLLPWQLPAAPRSVQGCRPSAEPWKFPGARLRVRRIELRWVSFPHQHLRLVPYCPKSAAASLDKAAALCREQGTKLHPACLLTADPALQAGRQAPSNYGCTQLLQKQREVSHCLLEARPVGIPPPTQAGWVPGQGRPRPGPQVQEGRVPSQLQTQLAPSSKEAAMCQGLPVSYMNGVRPYAQDGLPQNVGFPLPLPWDPHSSDGGSGPPRKGHRAAREDRGLELGGAVACPIRGLSGAHGLLGL